MKALWTGTDSLMLLNVSKRKLRKRVYWLLFRFYAKFLDYFVQEHYADHEKIADNLRKFGFKKPISVFPDKLLMPGIYQKKAHEPFYVLYYHPETDDDNFTRWLYGIDLIERAEAELTFCQFIKVDGSMDMKHIYPIVDFYLRPNRHDGAGRMVQECENNHIPYYHSRENPDYNQAAEKIINAYHEKYR